jgi:DNA polymerase-3 subunit alpha
MAFVHLHNHSEYSLLDGAAKVEDMARQAKEFGMQALAITDHGYMYGVPAFVKACKKEGVKPIIGCEVYFTPDSELRRDRKPNLYHMILLAKDLEGYHNLIKVVSQAAVDGFYYKPRVTLESLRDHAAGLIATSACLAGIIPKMISRNQLEDARIWAQKFMSAFAPGDFYLELQDQGLTTDEGMTQHELNKALTALAAELGIKTVAANDMHYLRQSDARTQDIMLCIGMNKKVDDPGRMRFSNDQFYLKSEEEMRAALKDFPEACDATVEIAEKCAVDLPCDLILPTVPLPEGETNASLLRAEALAGLKKRYGDPIPDEAMERFEYEFSIICDPAKDFSAYFLVVQEFTRWAKLNGVGVGPGRGSAAGSIISYALDITGLDPLENGLLFERFLSPERTEMPDIDIDFDEDGRFRVIEHLRELYGTEKVAHVVTYGSMKAKQAIQDAARVFDYVPAIGLDISKLVSNLPGTTLKGTLGIHEDKKRNRAERNPDLVQKYKEDPDTKKIIDAALELEGFIRGEGVHASAVIICRDPVDDHVPVKYDTKGGVIITQYDGEHNAELGLLKMDFLGLRTLNVLMKACQYIKENHGVEIDVDALPFDDPKVFEMFQRGDTAGVFQVESPGMTALIRSMNVDRYSDIVAAIALFRPGPLNSGMADDFVARKTGKRKVVYYDDRLAGILKETYGAMVYQEQVMRISMEMSGFTAGESDVVRKAVAKKNIKLMKETVKPWADGTKETMQDHWLNGAERNGYSRAMAQTIWDDVENFAEYAFNKSHSAAYAVLVMQTAWLKVHYPVEYMAAVLSSYVGKIERLSQYIAVCKQSGIDVLPPDVNSSGREFTAMGESIRFGLAGIRGVGEGAAETIIQERGHGGPFTSVHDFVFRVSNMICNKRTVESLIKSGAFDSTGYTRRQMMRFLDEDDLMAVAAKRHRDRAAGQVSIFDMFEEDDLDSGFEEQIPAPDGTEWDRRTKLGFEKEILNMYVSDHPLRPFTHILKGLADYSLGVFVENEDDDTDAAFDEEGAQGAGFDKVKVPQNRPITLAGMVTSFSPMVSKKGDRMAKFVLEDMEGSIEAIVFPKVFEQYGAALQANDLTGDPIVKLRCRYDLSDRGAQIIVAEVKRLELDETAAERPRVVELKVASSSFNQQVSNDLALLLKRYPGRDPVILFLTQSSARNLRIELPTTVDSRSRDLHEGLGVLLGYDAVAV